MSLTIGSIEQAAQLALASPTRIKPHVLPNRNIFSGDAFPFTALIQATETKMGPGQQPFRVPGSRVIGTQMTKAIQPKIQAYGTAPSSYECGADLAALTADTNANLTLVTTKALRKYSTIRNRRTGATVQVQSVTSTTVVVVRAFGGGSGGSGLEAHTSTDKYDYTGDIYPDGAQNQTGLRHDPEEYSNYLGLHVTETDRGLMGERLALYPDGTNNHATNLMINARRHNEGRERRFMFGDERGYSSSINGEYITAAKGLENMSSVEYDCEGVLTMDEMRMSVMPIIFSSGGGGRKMGLAGNTFLSVLDSLLDGKVVYTNPPEALNVRLKNFSSALGTVEFMGSQPMHEREGTAMFYDPDQLTRFVLEGLDMTFFQDVGPSDKLLTRDMYITCETILSPNPAHIAVITGALA